MDHIY